MSPRSERRLIQRNQISAASSRRFLKRSTKTSLGIKTLQVAFYYGRSCRNRRLAVNRRAARPGSARRLGGRIRPRGNPTRGAPSGLVTIRSMVHRCSSGASSPAWFRTSPTNGRAASSVHLSVRGKVLGRCSLKTESRGRRRGAFLSPPFQEDGRPWCVQRTSGNARAVVYLGNDAEMSAGRPQNITHLH